MIYDILVSRSFEKQFRSLPKNQRERIRGSLKALEENPLESRSGADIKPLRDTEPPKHRLRVGSYRIVYFVQGKQVKVIEVFSRGRGYR